MHLARLFGLDMPICLFLAIILCLQYLHYLTVYLIDHNRRTEGAHVFLEYTNNVEEAIVTLIHDHQWDEALRVVSIKPNNMQKKHSVLGLK